MPNTPRPEVKPRALAFYVILGATLFAFIQSFALLSPILLSFLLILLISLAVNPVISRMQALTGNRKAAAGLVAGGFITVIVLTGWALFGPMNASITNLAEQLPGYWERLQKPLIRMEQQAVLSEEKLQAEVTTEIAQSETAAGELESVQRTTEPTPPQSPQSQEKSVSLRSSLSGMFQGGRRCWHVCCYRSISETRSLRADRHDHTVSTRMADEEESNMVQ